MSSLERPTAVQHMSGADLTRVLNCNGSGLPKMMVVAEQLFELIGYNSERNNTSKELNQGRLKPHESVPLAKKEELSAEELSAVDARKVERSTQTAGQLLLRRNGPTIAHKTMQLDATVPANRHVARAAWPEHVKRLSSEVRTTRDKKRPV